MANAQSLEEVLRHVESLRCDLGAEIVVQESSIGYYFEEGQGHFEGGHDPGGYSSINEDNYYTPGTWVEGTSVSGQPRITKPDTEKRESARKQLQQINDSSSEWYSVKYAVARAFGVVDNKEIKEIGRAHV